VIAILLLTLFGLLAIVGGLGLALGGMLGIGFWIAEMIWPAVGWISFLLRIAGLFAGL
jgi:hypothetical protein